MNEVWSVKDVESYFGEHFANEIEVQDAMDEVGRRYERGGRGRRWSGVGFGDRMRLMREYLKEQFGIEARFCLGYRRVK